MYSSCKFSKTRSDSRLASYFSSFARRSMRRSIGQGFSDQWTKRDGNARDWCVWHITYRYHWQLEVDVDRYVIVSLATGKLYSKQLYSPLCNNNAHFLLDFTSSNISLRSSSPPFSSLRVDYVKIWKRFTRRISFWSRRQPHITYACANSYSYLRRIRTGFIFLVILLPCLP